MQVNKVVPTINGIEVKVGQIWRYRGAGLPEEIKPVNHLGPHIVTNNNNSYAPLWKHRSNDPNNHLVQLVEIKQPFTRSELHSMIKGNAGTIDFTKEEIDLLKHYESKYYSMSDKNVKETAPYFVKLNEIRNKLKKLKLQLKKLVVIQCKLKKMYNKSK